jgi:hypothetical protein
MKSEVQGMKSEVQGHIIPHLGLVILVAAAQLDFSVQLGIRHHMPIELKVITDAYRRCRGYVGARRLSARASSPEAEICLAPFEPTSQILLLCRVRGCLLLLLLLLLALMMQLLLL